MSIFKEIKESLVWLGIAKSDFDKATKSSGYKEFLSAQDTKSYTIYDFDGELVTLRVYGTHERNECYNGSGSLEYETRNIRVDTDVNKFIRVTEEELKKIKLRGVIELHDVRENETTPRGIEYIRKNIYSLFKVIEIHPIAKETTQGDSALSDAEMSDVEEKEENDFIMEEKVIAMKKQAIKSFMETNEDINIFVLGKIIRDRKISSYIVVSRDGRVGILEPEELKEYIKCKRVYKCALSGAGVTGINGFKVRDTINMNENSRYTYIRLLKKHFNQ